MRDAASNPSGGAGLTAGIGAGMGIGNLMGQALQGGMANTGGGGGKPSLPDVMTPSEAAAAMKVTEDDGKQCRLVFGNNILIPRNRANGGPAKVDHIAYTVTNWDAEKDGLEAELKRRKLEYTGTAKTSFQVKDPEGMGVQFGGLHQ